MSILHIRFYVSPASICLRGGGDDDKDIKPKRSKFKEMLEVIEELSQELPFNQRVRVSTKEVSGEDLDDDWPQQSQETSSPSSFWRFDQRKQVGNRTESEKEPPKQVLSIPILTVTPPSRLTSPQRTLQNPPTRANQVETTAPLDVGIDGEQNSAPPGATRVSLVSDTTYSYASSSSEIDPFAQTAGTADDLFKGKITVTLSTLQQSPAKVKPQAYQLGESRTPKESSKSPIPQSSSSPKVTSTHPSRRNRSAALLAPERVNRFTRGYETFNDQAASNTVEGKTPASDQEEDLSNQGNDLDWSDNHSEDENSNSTVRARRSTPGDMFSRVKVLDPTTGRLSNYATPWNPWEASQEVGRNRLDEDILRTARQLEPRSVSKLRKDLASLEREKIRSEKKTEAEQKEKDEGEKIKSKGERRAIREGKGGPRRSMAELALEIEALQKQITEAISSKRSAADNVQQTPQMENAETQAGSVAHEYLDGDVGAPERQTRSSSRSSSQSSLGSRKLDSTG